MQTVIVRYEGALAQSVEREIPGATTVELFNEYGVVTIPDGQLETLRALLHRGGGHSGMARRQQRAWRIYDPCAQVLRV